MKTWYSQGQRPGRGSVRGRAFTLIELLVVIAIISLLVSILLPSLNTAKELARAVYCATNMKTLGTTLHVYASEQNEYLPRYMHYEDEPDERFTSGYEWHRMYYPYISTNWVGRFQDDVAKECPVFDCPTTTMSVWQCGYVEIGSYDPYEHAGTKPKRFDYGVWAPIAGSNNDTTLSDWPPDQEFASEPLEINPWYSWGTLAMQGYNQARVFDYWTGVKGYCLGDHHLGSVNTVYMDSSVSRVRYGP